MTAGLQRFREKVGVSLDTPEREDAERKRTKVGTVSVLGVKALGIHYGGERGA